MPVTKELAGKNRGVAPRRLSARELSFCRDYIDGMSLDLCYSRNYSISPSMVGKKNAQNRAAYRIMGRPSVKRYIAEVRSAMVIESGIDVSWVLKESERLYNKCLVDDDNVTARSTLELIGKNRLVDAFSSKSSVEHTLKELPMSVSFNISFEDPTKSLQAQAQPQDQAIEGEIEDLELEDLDGE